MASESRVHVTFFRGLLCAVLLVGLLCVAWVALSLASDHNDGPSAANDQGLDIADLYAFMDPGFQDPALRDNVTLILTVRGFIAPGEAENMTVFQNNARFRFEIENTGDVAADKRIEVTFSDRQGFREPQIATIKLRDLNDDSDDDSDSDSDDDDSVIEFTAPTTIAVSDSPFPFFNDGVPSTVDDFVVTTDPTSGISFFAGQTDDPFFFDVPGELQFRNSLAEAVEAAGGPGSPVPPGGFGDTNVLLRERDTFAGYNILSIALSVPKELLLGPAEPVIGVSCFTDRLREPKKDKKDKKGEKEGNFFQVDRQGFPVINVVLIRYPRKRDYNRATPSDDANLMFADEIAGRLQELGTNAADINILANAVIVNGDQLRLDTSIQNIGPEGGTNPQVGFGALNGRRLADNAPDALVNIISNQQFVGVNAIDNGPLDNIDNVVNGIPDVDLVSANENPFRNEFPFLALPNQPLFPGDLNSDGITDIRVQPPVCDDKTRNYTTAAGKARDYGRACSPGVLFLVAGARS